MKKATLFLAVASSMAMAEEPKAEEEKVTEGEKVPDAKPKRCPAPSTLKQVEDCYAECKNFAPEIQGLMEAYMDKYKPEELPQKAIYELREAWEATVEERGKASLNKFKGSMGKYKSKGAATPTAYKPLMDMTMKQKQWYVNYLAHSLHCKMEYEEEGCFDFREVTQKQLYHLCRKTKSSGKGKAQVSYRCNALVDQILDFCVLERLQEEDFIRFDGEKMSPTWTWQVNFKPILNTKEHGDLFAKAACAKWCHRPAESLKRDLEEDLETVEDDDESLQALLQMGEDHVHRVEAPPPGQIYDSEKVLLDELESAEAMDNRPLPDHLDAFSMLEEGGDPKVAPVVGCAIL